MRTASVASSFAIAPLISVISVLHLVFLHMLVEKVQIISGLGHYLNLSFIINNVRIQVTCCLALVTQDSSQPNCQHRDKAAVGDQKTLATKPGRHFWSESSQKEFQMATDSPATARKVNQVITQLSVRKSKLT